MSLWIWAEGEEPIRRSSRRQSLTPDDFPKINFKTPNRKFKRQLVLPTLNMSPLKQVKIEEEQATMSFSSDSETVDMKPSLKRRGRPPKTPKNDNTSMTQIKTVVSSTTKHSPIPSYEKTKTVSVKKSLPRSRSSSRSRKSLTKVPSPVSSPTVVVNEPLLLKRRSSRLAEKNGNGQVNGVANGTSPLTVKCEYITPPKTVIPPLSRFNTASLWAGEFKKRYPVVNNVMIPLVKCLLIAFVIVGMAYLFGVYEKIPIWKKSAEVHISELIAHFNK